MKLKGISAIIGLLLVFGCSRKNENSFPMESAGELMIMLHKDEDTLKSWLGEPFETGQSLKNKKELLFRDDAGNLVTAILEDRYGNMLVWELIFCPQNNDTNLLKHFNESDGWIQRKHLDDRSGYYFVGQKSIIVYSKGGCLHIKDEMKPEPVALRQ